MDQTAAPVKSSGSSLAPPPPQIPSNWDDQQQSSSRPTVSSVFDENNPWQPPPPPPSNYKGVAKPPSSVPLQATVLTSVRETLRSSISEKEDKNEKTPPVTPKSQKKSVTSPSMGAHGGFGGFAGVDLTKGKGAKMFQRQQDRMGRYTREVSEDQAKATKQAAIQKKKAIESGEYVPMHGPQMAAVLPQMPVNPKPSSNRSSAKSSGGRMSTYTPSSTKLQDGTTAPCMNFADKLMRK